MNLKECKKFYYDQTSADRAIFFIENHITHIKGELGGTKFKLLKFQKKIIGDLFGWKHRETNLRRFRTAYIAMPRKNGKSTLISGIALYMLLADKEPSAECYVAAGDRAQAGIIFDVASSMVQMDPQLNKHLKVFKNSIIHEKSNSTFKAISSEAASKFGYNAHFIAMDEFFIQRDSSLWDALTTSTGSRRQPLSIAITTAGYNKESICYQVQEYGRKVSEGSIKDDSFYYINFHATLEDDWTDPKIWEKANPGLKAGVLKYDYLQTESDKAQRMPSYENTFKMLHLNIWTESVSRWLSDKQFMECDLGDFKLSDFKGFNCYAGLDLASVRDITAFVLLFVKNDMYYVLPYFFAPKENAFIRSRRDGVDYINWSKEGHIFLTPGDVTDYNFIKSKIKEIGEQVVFKTIHYDRWNASQLVIDLTEEGIPMTPFGQGFASMSAPSKELEKIILNKELNHQGNPVLRWMCSNLAMKFDPAGNIKMDKSKSTEKIDGMVATVMALGAYMNDDDPDSNYNDRGIVFL